MIPHLMPGKLGESSGSAPFSPLDIANCGLWLDMLDTTTLFDATSGGSLPALDAGVARIEDKSGNGRHYTQGTGANQPLRKVDGLYFDGTNDWMGQVSGLDLVRNVSGLTMAIVYSTPSRTTNQAIWVAAANDAAFVRSGLYLGLSTQRRLSVGNRRLDSNSNIYVSETSDIENDTRYVVTGVLDYANSDAYVYRNGVLTGSSTSFQTNGSTENINSANIRLGINSVYSNYTLGTISEVIVYQQSLPSGDRDDLEEYLAAKHGITL